MHFLPGLPTWNCLKSVSRRGTDFEGGCPAVRRQSSFLSGAVGVNAPVAPRCQTGRTVRLEPHGPGRSTLTDHHGLLVCLQRSIVHGIVSRCHMIAGILAGRFNLRTSLRGKS